MASESGQRAIAQAIRRTATVLGEFITAFLTLNEERKGENTVVS
jgi:hypothetical protein